MHRTAITLVLTTLVAFASGCAAAPVDETAEQKAQLGMPAPPIALSGEYRPSGTVEASMRLTYDVVDVRMSGAAERLASLRANGATCELVISNTYRCKTFGGAAGVPAASLAKIAAKNESFVATFGAVSGPPRIVSDAESLTEWEIQQEGTSPAGEFEAYSYLQLSGGLVKIRLPNASAGGEAVELIVRDGSSLRKWDRVSTTENRWRWHEDTALVVLTR